MKPEEVYLCVLCHYFVHPPAVDQATGVPLPPQQSSHRIAHFLLKLLKAGPRHLHDCDIFLSAAGRCGLRRGGARAAA